MQQRRNLLDLFLILVAAAAVAWIYQRANGFYDVPHEALVDHPQYDEFRSAGRMGKLLGTVAIAMFLFNMLYLPRRRMRVLHRLGSLRHWMSAHVFFGLLGGGLIGLHAVFRMTSEAARMSAIAVVVLIATGIVGRYLYALVPHTATGEEEPEGLAGRAEQSLSQVSAVIGEGDPLIDQLRGLANLGAPPERNLLRALVRLPIEPLRRVVAGLRVQFALRRAWGRHKLGDDQRAVVRAAAVETVGFGHAYAFAGVAARILRSWRPVHLLAALIMGWSAYVHIESAFEQGYGWKVPAYWPLWLAAALALPLVALGLEVRLRLSRKRRKVNVFATDGPAPEPPATLHPYIDPNICMGSGACVAACPEGDILDLLDGRSRLVEPSHCVGHGECARNCPVNAITLVFGTSRRGVDIPDVSEHFESDVPGIYLIGEITGMGLIRNAVKQANQAVVHLARQAKRDKASADAPPMTDVCIIGAGPAGIAATLACQEAGLSTITLEQEPNLGGAVNHYPRRKLVMLAPMDLRGYGKIKLWDARKEELVDLWKDVQTKTGIEVAHGVNVGGIEPFEGADGFEVIGAPVGLRPGMPGYEELRFPARRVMIAVGRRGAPRRLGVLGEAQDHVAYTVLEPDQHTGRKVLVVGGGDSALENAFACADAGAAAVHLVYRRSSFDRAKVRNRERLDEAVAAGNIKLHLERSPARIHEDSVVLDGGETIQADDVIVCVGGTLPTGLLRAAGCEVKQHFGRPIPPA